MKNELKFYICPHCGNIITKMHDSGVPVICCGEVMEEIVPGTIDASVEKHVPVAEINNDVVVIKVGSEPHPMIEEHHIVWIVIETMDGFQVKYLDKLGVAEATFKTDEKVIRVYEYCNLHGLWKLEIK